MWRQFRLFLEMIRFSHTLFALPFALLAAIVAWRIPTVDRDPISFRFLDLVGILVCMAGARSAAMAFNRLVDRKIDAANPRTQNRHLPQGTLSMTAVILFTVASSLVFIAGTLLFWPNLLPLVLSLPVLGVLFVYSYTKRFTSLAHYWLGISLMLAPIATWIALRGEAVMAHPLDLLPALLIGLAVLFWVAGFDIIYACQDYDFDVQAKLNSVPTRWGVPGALRIAAASHAIMVLILVGLPFASWLGGPAIPLGGIYYLGLVPIVGLVFYQHFVVRPDDLSRVNLAFFQLNVLISVGLLAIVSLDLYL